MKIRPPFIILAAIGSIIAAAYNFSQSQTKNNSPPVENLRYTKAFLLRQLGSVPNIAVKEKPILIYGVINGSKFNSKEITIDNKYIEFKANGSWYYITTIAIIDNALSAQIFGANGYQNDAWISPNKIGDKLFEFTTARKGESVIVKFK